MSHETPPTGYKVKFAPRFIEQMSHLSEEERAMIMEKISGIPDMLAANPFAADPVGRPRWFNAYWRVRRWLRRRIGV